MRHVVTIAGLFVLLAGLTSGCLMGTPTAARLSPGTVTCAYCGRTVNDPLLAAQLVAPGADPMFFDDISCLIEHLSRNTRLKPRSMAYVADHVTGEWIPAVSALYTRNLKLVTPMNSHLAAHASLATQQQDPIIRGGSRVSVRELLPIDMPDGTR
jgi:copper chaperone NosL